MTCPDCVLTGPHDLPSGPSWCRRLAIPEGRPFGPVLGIVDQTNRYPSAQVLRHRLAKEGYSKPQNQVQIDFLVAAGSIARICTLAIAKQRWTLNVFGPQDTDERGYVDKGSGWVPESVSEFEDMEAALNAWEAVAADAGGNPVVLVAPPGRQQAIRLGLAEKSPGRTLEKQAVREARKESRERAEAAAATHRHS